MAEEYIYNTDFYKAIRKNKRNSAILIFCMFILLFCLGYLMGNFIELSTDRPYGYSYDSSHGDSYTHAFNRDYHRGSYLDTAQNFNFRGYENSSDRDYANTIFQLSQTGITFGFFALLIGIFWSLIAVFAGPKIILSSANARELSESDEGYAVLSNVVQEVAIAAGAPVPKIYMIDTDQLNAFATGMSPQSGIVAVTKGLFNTLTRDELQGVMAHEMGHIINYDIRYQTLVSIIVGLIVLISDIASRMVFTSGRTSNRNERQGNNNGAAIIGLVLILFSVIAPIAALMLQLAVSRQREYLADATGVKLTRNSLGLINALHKLAVHAQPFPGASKANQNLWIVNPFKGVANIKNSLFSTHPPLEDRIARLKNLNQ